MRFRKFIDFTMLIIGTLGILDFIFLMSIGTVINFGILFPLVAGMILFMFGILRITGKDHLVRIKNTFIRRTIITLIVVFAASFILVQGLIVMSIKPDTNIKADYMVILGAGLKGDIITPTFRNRLDKGIDYLKQNPGLKVVVTGGQGPQETVTEASAMDKYLKQNGIEPDRIILEDRATSTFENFKYTKEVLNGATGRSDYNVLIVTNDFHMFRSKLLAERNGFKAYGLTADTNPYVLANCCIREYFAVIKSILFDF